MTFLLIEIYSEAIVNCNVAGKIFASLLLIIGLIFMVACDILIYMFIIIPMVLVQVVFQLFLVKERDWSMVIETLTFLRG